MDILVQGTIKGLIGLMQGGWFDDFKTGLLRYFRRQNALTRSAEQEHVHVLDSLHQQFLKEELIHHSSGKVSQARRQTYAKLVGVADQLSREDTSLNETLCRLVEAGLDSLIATTDEVSDSAKYSRIVAEAVGLIRHWEEPHLEQHALPILKKALEKKLRLPSN